MERASVSYISRMTGLHGNTIRRWADRGLIRSKKDFRGWRFFPNPQETIERIRGLLNGDIGLDGQSSLHVNRDPAKLGSARRGPENVRSFDERT